MMPENKWRNVRPTSHPDGTRTVLMSAVVDGVRLWCETHWGKPDSDGKRQLLHERFWGSDAMRVYRTAEAALAAEMQPIESNEP